MFSNRILNRFVSSICGAKLTIFTLHRLEGDHGLTGFNLELILRTIERLKSAGVEFVYLDEVLELRKKLSTSKNYVCITIDDGYRDQADFLIPKLLELGAKPTLFVVTSLIDSKLLPWDARLASGLNQLRGHYTDLSALKLKGVDIVDDNNRRSVRHALSAHAKRLSKTERLSFLSKFEQLVKEFGAIEKTNGFEASDWDSLRALEKRGLRIGSHSVSHQPLSTLSEADILFEAESSIRTLKKHLANPSDIFCYPVGLPEDIQPAAKNILQECNYAGAVTASPGYVGPNTDPFYLPRIGMPHSESLCVRYTSWFEKIR